MSLFISLVRRANFDVHFISTEVSRERLNNLFSQDNRVFRWFSYLYLEALNAGEPTPIVLGPGKRFGCNMISSISNRGTLRFMVFTDRFNSDVMLRFLKRLLKYLLLMFFSTTERVLAAANYFHTF